MRDWNIRFCIKLRYPFKAKAPAKKHLGSGEKALMKWSAMCYLSDNYRLISTKRGTCFLFISQSTLAFSSQLLQAGGENNLLCGQPMLYNGINNPNRSLSTLNYVLNLYL